MKTNRLRLLPDKKTVALLKTLGDRVSALWNVANYTCRQAFLKGERVPGYEALCGLLKGHPDYRALPSDVAQEVLKYLAKAWKSYFALRENWQSGNLRDKPGLPKYRKNRKTGKRPTDWIPVKSPRAYAIDAQRVALTLPADLRTQGRLQILYRGLRRYVGPMKTAEVRFDRMRGRWYFHYRVETPEREPRPWRRAASPARADLQGVRDANAQRSSGIEEYPAEAASRCCLPKNTRNKPGRGGGRPEA